MMNDEMKCIPAWSGVGWGCVGRWGGKIGCRGVWANESVDGGALAIPSRLPSRSRGGVWQQPRVDESGASGQRQGGPGKGRREGGRRRIGYRVYTLGGGEQREREREWVCWRTLSANGQDDEMAWLRCRITDQDEEDERNDAQGA